MKEKKNGPNVTIHKSIGMDQTLTLNNTWELDLEISCELNSFSKKKDQTYRIKS